MSDLLCVTTIDKVALIEKVREILQGIDAEEIESSDFGWWETSAQADFGRKKLEAVICAIRDA